jgi:hypothetical protein
VSRLSCLPLTQQTHSNMCGFEYGAGTTGACYTPPVNPLRGGGFCCDVFYVCLPGLTVMGCCSWEATNNVTGAG